MTVWLEVDGPYGNGAVGKLVEIGAGRVGLRLVVSVQRGAATALHVQEADDAIQVLAGGGEIDRGGCGADLNRGCRRGARHVESAGVVGQVQRQAAQRGKLQFRRQCGACRRRGKARRANQSARQPALAEAVVHRLVASACCVSIVDDQGSAAAAVDGKLADLIQVLGGRGQGDGAGAKRIDDGGNARARHRDDVGIGACVERHLLRLLRVDRDAWVIRRPIVDVFVGDGNRIGRRIGGIVHGHHTRGGGRADR